MEIYSYTMQEVDFYSLLTFNGFAKDTDYFKLIYKYVHLLSTRRTVWALFSVNIQL